jgi:hypothetical protein
MCRKSVLKEEEEEEREEKRMDGRAGRGTSVSGSAVNDEHAQRRAIVGVGHALKMGKVGGCRYNDSITRKMRT